MGAIRSWLSLVIVAALAVSSAAAQPPSTEAFVTVNGVRLHYLDWGGNGRPLLFLTSLGSNAHQFDALAPEFVDRFRVLALTRRGKEPSDKPPSGYDTTTLAEDIKGFLDAMHIDRVSLAGYSIAGDEETRFAALFPDRVEKLVYLDAAYDRKSGIELARKPAYPMPLPKFEGPIGETVKGASAADPDYTKVSAPALAFYVIYETPQVPPGTDPFTESKLIAGWPTYGEPFLHAQVNRFRREMKRGRVIELRDTNHVRFLIDPATQRFVVREMRKFLLDE
jgi:pimeloyl-ACP methyl ester carboxylesterase